ncbi:MAG: SRPBCC family protein [Nocardioides sp.]
MHVERTFTVPLPPEAVFAYLSDFTNTNEWDPGTIETKRTGGDGGIGTTYANISEFMGRRVELDYETITHEQPTKVQFRGRNKSATATDSLTFTAAGAGTSIHYRADFVFSTLVNLVAPILLRGKLERLADETVEQIQRALA